MAMEERQTHVQVGAGLQESRLNTDLINFLQKYGSWALYALLVVVLGYLGWEKYSRWQESRLDAAFSEYEAAAITQNPASLLEIAKEHEGLGAVSELARFDAARFMLQSARVGLRPGASTLNPTTADKLDDSTVKKNIADAKELLQGILSRTGTNKNMVALAQQTRWWLATAQLDAGDFDGAKSTLEAAAAAADKAGNPPQAAIIRARLADLPKLKDLKPLYTLADLPESARPPKPAGSEAAPTGGPVVGANGKIDPSTIPVPKVPEGATVRPMTPEELERARAQMKGNKGNPIVPPTPAPTPGPGATPPAGGAAPTPAPAPAPTTPAPAPSEPKPN